MTSKPKDLWALYREYCLHPLAHILADQGRNTGEPKTKTDALEMLSDLYTKDYELSENSTQLGGPSKTLSDDSKS
jgi:hypothetical protein